MRENNYNQVTGKQCELVGAVTSITICPGNKAFFVGTSLSNRCVWYEYVKRHPPDVLPIESVPRYERILSKFVCSQMI